MHFKPLELQTKSWNREFSEGSWDLLSLKALTLQISLSLQLTITESDRWIHNIHNVKIRLWAQSVLDTCQVFGRST